MGNEPSRETVIAVLRRIEAGLFDATYRLGRLRQSDRQSRDLAAVAINLQSARHDLVALLDHLDGGEGPSPS